MSVARLELHMENGSILIADEVASSCFPSGVVATQVVDRELRIYPLRSHLNGGVPLKVRDSSGTRSVPVYEFGGAVGGNEGECRGSWSDEFGCWCVDLGPRDAVADRIG